MSKNIEEFAESAKNFCWLIGDMNDIEENIFYENLKKALFDLKEKAKNLPDQSIEEPEEEAIMLQTLKIQLTLSKLEWKASHKLIEKWFNVYNSLKVKLKNKLNEEELHNFSDYVSDICFFLILKIDKWFRTEDEKIIWEWKEGYQNVWGEDLINSLEIIKNNNSKNA